jgi:hypothetical protein
MDIQIIQDNAPLRGLGIAGDQVLEMGQGILLSARRPPGRFDDISCDHVEIDEPGQNAMSNILELAPQHMTRLHRQVRICARLRLALRSIHPC